jgi:hypothetical protein
MDIKSDHILGKLVFHNSQAVWPWTKSSPFWAPVASSGNGLNNNSYLRGLLWRLRWCSWGAQESAQHQVKLNANVLIWYMQLITCILYLITRSPTWWQEIKYSVDCVPGKVRASFDSDLYSPWCLKSF